MITPQRLRDLERHYNGEQVRVPRRKVSPLDPRTPEQIAKGGMIGGDRMTDHGYAEVYARWLPEKADVVVECGILRGVGLAVMADLYRNAVVVGLDIDLSHFHSNLLALRGRGAFSNPRVSVLSFDQLAPAVPDGLPLPVDIFIDDGLHTDEAITRTFDAFMPHMADKFVYFIEDNDTAWRLLELPEGVTMHRYGYMTVVTRC